MIKMKLQAIAESEARFEAYVQQLSSVIGHKDRAEPLLGYACGLLTACGRKSVEPLAAVTCPARVFREASVATAFRGQSAVVR